jgi:hypothetical protein
VSGVGLARYTPANWCVQSAAHLLRFRHSHPDDHRIGGWEGQPAERKRANSLGRQNSVAISNPSLETRHSSNICGYGARRLRNNTRATVPSECCIAVRHSKIRLCHFILLERIPASLGGYLTETGRSRESARNYR